MVEKHIKLDQTPKFSIIGIEDIGFGFVERGVPDSLAAHLQKIINKTLPKTVKVNSETKSTIREKIEKELKRLVKKKLLYRDPLDHEKWIFTNKGSKR